MKCMISSMLVVLAAAGLASTGASAELRTTKGRDKWTDSPNSHYHWSPSPGGGGGGQSKCPVEHRVISKGDESRLKCSVGTPGNFTVYALALAESGQTKTLHGLWPNYNPGNQGYPWPQYCSSEAFNATKLSSISGLRSAMNQYWPSISHFDAAATVGSSSSGNEKFWSHEWSRHGTCTGYTQAEFFCTAINFFLKVSGSMQSAREPFTIAQVQAVPHDRLVSSGSLRAKGADWWTHSPDHKWHPHHKWTHSPDHKWTESPDHKWTESPDHKHNWTESPDHKWTESPHGHNGGGGQCPVEHRVVSKGDESRLKCTVGTPGNFSVYALATESGKSGSSKTLHGLWPNYQSGNMGYPWPQYCTQEAFNATSLNNITGLRAAMNQYWPGASFDGSSNSQGDEKFWSHEWSRHGTCSGYTQQAFFCTALNFFLKVSGSMSGSRQVYTMAQVEAVPHDRVELP